jgi:2'-5' RNA ligase
MKPVTGKNRRLFFALWPDQTLRQQIRHDLVGRLHLCGRPVTQQNWHITLVFLGNISEQQFACVLEAGDAITAEPFTVCLDKVGHFARARVGWVGCSQVPSMLQELVKDLTEALRPCGYAPQYQTYRPHLTLMRKAARAPVITGTIKPVEWPVNRFVLVQSETHQEGVVYTPIHEWSLG